MSLCDGALNLYYVLSANSEKTSRIFSFQYNALLFKKLCESLLNVEQDSTSGRSWKLNKGFFPIFVDKWIYR